MKKCSYCGFENKDDSVSCHECGQQIFIEPMVPTNTVKRSFNFRMLARRLLAAAAIWLVVSCISIYVAWGNASHNDDFRWEQYITRLRLKAISASITAYRQKNGVAPRSLSDLVKTDADDPWAPEDMAHPMDAWEHPMIASTNSSNLVVTSFGRDGKPGGFGLDYDLTTENPNPNEARPTLMQFLNDEHAKGMIMSCIICGGFAGFLGFLIVKIPELNRTTLIKLAIKLIVMVAVAVFMASIIAALHIPAHEH